MILAAPANGPWKLAVNKAGACWDENQNNPAGEVLLGRAA